MLENVLIDNIITKYLEWQRLESVHSCSTKSSRILTTNQNGEQINLHSHLIKFGTQWVHCILPILIFNPVREIWSDLEWNRKVSILYRWIVCFSDTRCSTFATEPFWKHIIKLVIITWDFIIQCSHIWLLPCEYCSGNFFFKFSLEF